MFGTGIPTHPKKFPPLGSVGLQYFSDRYWKYLLVLHVSLYRYHLRSVNMIFPIWVCGVSGIKISSVYRGKVVSKCRLTDLWKDVFSTLRIDIFPQTLMTFLSGSNMILSQTLMIQVCFFWGLKWVFFYKHGAIGRRYGLRRWWIECWQWEQCHSSEEWKWKWERLAAGVDLSKEKWAFWQIGLGRVGKGWEINLQNTKLGTLECGLQSWEIYSERISLLNS